MKFYGEITKLNFEFWIEIFCEAAFIPSALRKFFFEIFKSFITNNFNMFKAIFGFLLCFRCRDLYEINKALAPYEWSKKLEPAKQRYRKPTKIDMELLKKDIEQYPDSYCYERAQRLGVSATGIRDAQYRLGVSYKKNSKASESGSRKKIYVLPKNR